MRSGEGGRSGGRKEEEAEGGREMEMRDGERKEGKEGRAGR